MTSVAPTRREQILATAAELFAAMNTTDADNQGRTRGYVLVRKAEAAATTPAN